MNAISPDFLLGLNTPSTDPNMTPAAPASVTTGDAPESEPSFGSVLQDAVNVVERMHNDAQQQVTQLATGERQDIHNVMIAVEKADIAFQLMMQVRNKIVNAYQEVSKMQF